MASVGGGRKILRSHRYILLFAGTSRRKSSPGSDRIGVPDRESTHRFRFGLHFNLTQPGMSDAACGHIERIVIGRKIRSSQNGEAENSVSAELHLSRAKHRFRSRLFPIRPIRASPRSEICESIILSIRSLGYPFDKVTHAEI